MASSFKFFYKVLCQNMKQITILKKKDTDDVTSTQIRMVCQIKCRVLIEIKSNLPVSSGSILQLFSSAPLVVIFFKLP